MELINKQQLCQVRINVEEIAEDIGQYAQHEGRKNCELP